MQYYEEVKANNRMKYDSEGPKKIGEAFFVHLAFISPPSRAEIFTHCKEFDQGLSGHG